MGSYKPHGISNWKVPTISAPPDVGPMTAADAFQAFVDQMPEPHPTADRHVRPSEPIRPEQTAPTE